MKKIVVVVRMVAGLSDRQVIFEGENLEVIDRSVASTGYNNKLVIRDMSKDAGNRTVAVFREWVYWREEDETLDGADREEITQHKICQNCGKPIGPDGGNILCRKCLDKMPDQT